MNGHNLDVLMCGPFITPVSSTPLPGRGNWRGYLREATAKSFCVRAILVGTAVRPWDESGLPEPGRFLWVEPARTKKKKASECAKYLHRMHYIHRTWHAEKYPTAQNN